MNNLNELIGKKVIATVMNNKFEEVRIPAIVTNVLINDYYFEEKGEQIYIDVYLEAPQELPSNIDEDQLIVSLENIEKYN